MDGRNCTGRRISLLNDSFSTTKTLNPLDPQPLLASKFSSSPSKSSSSISTTSTFWSSNRPILAHPGYSRSYSSSTTASEPPTPLLVRSESTDSISQRTPSPLTPNLSLERLSIMSGAQGQASYGKSPYGDPDQLAAATILPYTLYPSTGAAVPYTNPTHLPQSNPSPPPSIPQTAVRPLAVPIQQSQSQPQQQQRPALVQQTSSYRSRRAPVKSSKNTYPCPLGIQFSCDRYFTTSGHAARHAKIHSGEKNIQCPECDKKFARKDNMDQHRKTHRRTGGGMDSDNAQDLSEVDSTVDDEHHSELKASAKLRRARKRNMRSPEPSSLRGLRTESDESLSTSHTTDSEGPYVDEERQRRHQRPRTSSNGSNSLDVLANVALGRGVYDSDA